MKRVIIPLVILLCFCKISMADTISYWHVYYNKAILGQFSETSKDPIIKLKLSDIKHTDSLTTHYFKDTPCENCQVNLLIQDDKINIFKQVKNFGTFSPLIISLYELSMFLNKNKSKYFEFYYFEERIESKFLLYKFVIN
jgi:hypothetical protein